MKGSLYPVFPHFTYIYEKLQSGFRLAQTAYMDYGSSINTPPEKQKAASNTCCLQPSYATYTELAFGACLLFRISSLVKKTFSHFEGVPESVRAGRGRTRCCDKIKECGEFHVLGRRYMREE